MYHMEKEATLFQNILKKYSLKSLKDRDAVTYLILTHGLTYTDLTFH